MIIITAQSSPADETENLVRQDQFFICRGGCKSCDHGYNLMSSLIETCYLYKSAR
jgi:hypothetical protein